MAININLHTGLNIYKLRSMHKIKQAAFAKQLGVSRKTLSNYENLKTEVPTQIAVKVANYFKIDLLALISTAIGIANILEKKEKL